MRPAQSATQGVANHVFGNFPVTTIFGKHKIDLVAVLESFCRKPTAKIATDVNFDLKPIGKGGSLSQIIRLFLLS